MSQARVAQLAERQVSNLNVEGSIPFSCFVFPNISSLRAIATVSQNMVLTTIVSALL